MAQSFTVTDMVQEAIWQKCIHLISIPLSGKRESKRAQGWPIRIGDHITCSVNFGYLPVVKLGTCNSSVCACTTTNGWMRAQGSALPTPHTSMFPSHYCALCLCNAVSIPWPSSQVNMSNSWSSVNPTKAFSYFKKCCMPLCVIA